MRDSTPTRSVRVVDGCTARVLACSLGFVDRINVTLDDAHAAKLAALAERMHVQAGTLARSLLQSALDDTDPDARTMVELLDGLDGAFAAAQRGSREAREGHVIGLDEL